MARQEALARLDKVTTVVRVHLLLRGMVPAAVVELVPSEKTLNRRLRVTAAMVALGCRLVLQVWHSSTPVAAAAGRKMTRVAPLAGLAAAVVGVGIRATVQAVWTGLSALAAEAEAAE